MLQRNYSQGGLNAEIKPGAGNADDQGKFMMAIWSATALINKQTHY